MDEIEHHFERYFRFVEEEKATLHIMVEGRPVAEVRPYDRNDIDLLDCSQQRTKWPEI